jgi:hypothetical protein
MTNEEFTNVSKDLYRVFGKIRNLDPKNLHDKRCVNLLEEITGLLGDASLKLEVLTGSQIRPDIDAYFNYLKDLDKLKRKEIFFQID